MRRRLTLLAAACALAAVAACGYSDPYAGTGPIADESPGASAAPSVSPGADDFNAGAGLPVVTYPDGLKVIDLTSGTGELAKQGENATVQYTGWFTNGTVFDTSRQAGRGPFPFTLTIGAGVIDGWVEGVQGMKVGGRRKLIIPPALAYGPQGRTDPNTGATIIPQNATLVFEIELLSVAPGPTPSPTPPPAPSASPTPSAGPTPT